MQTRRWLIGGVGLLIAGAVAVPTVLARTRVEEPTFTVMSEHDGFEVRKYAPRIVAEVEVTGAPRQATNAGFRVLADFIFGNNSTSSSISMTAPVDRTASEKIAMTAPVDRRKTASDGEAPAWTVAFTMPSKYTLETLPKPNDPRVQIREVPSTAYAVARFRGSPNEAQWRKRTDELVAQIEAAGLRCSDAEPTYARYDPPWTPGFLRRNEIFVELALPPEA